MTLTFTLEIPEPFRFGSIHQMGDGRLAVSLFGTNEKGLERCGLGYGEDIAIATTRAAERLLTVLKERDPSGFVPTTRSSFEPAQRKREIETNLDLSNLKLEL